MAKGKLKLKWRRNQYGMYFAGPFSTGLSKSRGFREYPVFTHIDDCVVTIYCATLNEAKRACEKLASRILGAMK